jgi:hypothetical protein
VQYTGNNNDFSASGAVYTNGAFGNGFTVGQPFVLTAVADRPQTWVTAIGDYWGNLEFTGAPTAATSPRS